MSRLDPDARDEVEKMIADALKYHATKEDLARSENRSIIWAIAASLLIVGLGIAAIGIAMNF